MKMLVQRTAISANNPFSLSDLKAHLRVDHDDDDAAITNMGWTAAAEVENFAQIALLTQSIRVTIFNPIRGSGLSMPIGPVADTLVLGARDGWFTGRRLRDYIASTGVDFRGARRIINGTDAATQIAEIATDYLAALTPAPILIYPHIRLGARCAAVMQAQTLLSAQGLVVGAIDGVFGPITAAAIREFQRSAGLTADGIIGPVTWAALIPTEGQ